jgi:uncharacterized phiE125 gp8 family phage protein
MRLSEIGHSLTLLAPFITRLQILFSRSLVFKDHTRMQLERITEPTFSFVSPQRVRRNSRIPDHEEDDWIEDAIESATEYCEDYLECKIALATYEWTLDAFPRNRGSIPVPVWPVNEILAVEYLDPNNAVQTVDLARIVQPIGSRRYQLRLRDHACWPSTRCTPNAVTIRFRAGWPSAGAVPKTLTRAGLMLISHWYENRETILIGTASKEIEHGTAAMLEQLRPAEDLLGAD